MLMMTAVDIKHCVETCNCMIRLLEIIDISELAAASKKCKPPTDGVKSCGRWIILVDFSIVGGAHS
jgi:hypothetical protein